MENSLTYKIRKIDKKLYFDNTEVIQYHIEYLIFISPNKNFQIINDQNRNYAKILQNYIEDTMYNNAVQAYSNGNLDLPYQFENKITVTLNQNGIFSGYQETYILMGGSQGSTSRAAFYYNEQGDSYSLCSFVSRKDCITCITSNIVQQIQNSIQENQYFPNYAILVPQLWHPEDFYVTTEGVVAYFAPYKIGPYTLGLPSFTIPFSACQ